ncbi:MAG: hypothetical protein OXL40_03270 [Bacteroidota bacterium]|nr:hypothetical protein [Bacteroidota bacterium]
MNRVIPISIETLWPITLGSESVRFAAHCKTDIDNQYLYLRLRALPSILLLIVRTDRTTDALYTINRIYGNNVASNCCSWSKIVLNGFLGYDR